MESTGEPFKDESQVVLPPSFNQMDQHIRWLRPREYLQQMHLINETKRQLEVKKSVFRPRRSSTRVIGALVGLGEEAKDSIQKEQSQLSVTEGKGKNNIYIDLAAPQSDSKASPIKIMVVNTIERDEAPEEKLKRLEKAEEEKKAKGKKPPPSIHIYKEE